MTSRETPLSEGYRMPPEWGPHARCWMAWPCRAETFSGRLDEAREATAAVAKAIASFEPVCMVVRTDAVADMSIMCGPGVTAFPTLHDDSWMRDNGPTFVTRVTDEGNQELAGVAWKWNAWGESYPEHTNDAAVAKAVLRHLKAPVFEGPLVLEGGSVHVDSAGTALVTEECLLNPNRNPGLTREEIEAELKAHFGLRSVIWLGQGWVDDETSGHVDNVACFVAPGVVLAQTCNDPSDPNHAIWRDNLARLQAAKDANDRPLEVIEIEQPKVRMGVNGRRLTLSYVNFYMANSGIVMPSFEDPQDGRAYDILSKLFPNRRVEQINALDILEGGGGIHCITRQEPAVS